MRYLKQIFAHQISIGVKVGLFSACLFVVFSHVTYLLLGQKIRWIKYLRRNLVFLVIAVGMVSHNAYAYNDYYKQNKRGWFWFERNVIQEQKKSVSDIDETTEADKALHELEDLQEEFKKRNAAQIMRPSVENAAKFAEVQNEMFRKADIVKGNWQAAMLKYPELNLVKDIPISQIGSKITREKEDRENLVKHQAFAKEYKFLFFYKSGCPYCEHFAKVLLHYSKKYGAKVAAVTLDGKQIAEFPGSMNPALVEKFNVTSTPTVYAFSDEKGVAIPVSHGFLPIDLFERNVLFVIEQLKRQE